MTSVKGFVYRKLARYGRCRSVKEAEKHLSDSSECYVKAARLLPEDEEYRHCKAKYSLHDKIKTDEALLCIGYLSCAISSAFRGGAPVRVTLPLLEELRVGIPKMDDLWELSPLASSDRDKKFRMLKWFEEDVRKALGDGSINLESKILPDVEQDPSTL